MAASALSPASSPRLPSPPPIAEDQLGPKSPIAGSDEHHKLSSKLDAGGARRIRPGTRAADMAEGPPLVELSEIESGFQLTEHLKALHQDLTHPAGLATVAAVDRDTAHRLVQPPDGVDKTLWLYELCRFLTQKVNSVIVALFQDSPPCSATTCPEMRASEWQYLCAVHDPPKSCCAIDYCCHTLDWAANLLTSPKTFPSRLALGNDQATHSQQIRHLTNIFRRLYRIFAHAWFQHRDMFWKVETRSGLYILFKTVCDVYGLIPEDNYTIPPEAEGLDSPQEAPPTILRREPSNENAQDRSHPMDDSSLSTAGTTKRHRHSPSVGATAVSTVVEEAEEDWEPEEADDVSVIEIHDADSSQEPVAQADEEEPSHANAAENTQSQTADTTKTETTEPLAPSQATDKTTSEADTADGPPAPASHAESAPQTSASEAVSAAPTEAENESAPAGDASGTAISSEATPPEDRDAQEAETQAEEAGAPNADEGGDKRGSEEKEETGA